MEIFMPIGTGTSHATLPLGAVAYNVSADKYTHHPQVATAPLALSHLHLSTHALLLLLYPCDVHISPVCRWNAIPSHAISTLRLVSYWFHAYQAQLSCSATCAQTARGFTMRRVAVGRGLRHLTVESASGVHAGWHHCTPLCTRMTDAR